MKATVDVDEIAQSKVGTLNTQRMKAWRRGNAKETPNGSSQDRGSNKDTENSGVMISSRGPSRGRKRRSYKLNTPNKDRTLCDVEVRRSL